jgi:hypothetical protein
MKSFFDRFVGCFVVGMLLLIGICIRAEAQTAGTVTLTATPASGNGSVTPTLTWSTSPAAIGCTASGAWSGSKAASGTLTAPAIASTSSYKLTCSWSGGDAGATVSWTPPNTNSDGSTLTDLAGFRVMAGRSSSDLDLSVYVSDAKATSARLGPLANGTWYFAVRAVNSKGFESANSNVGQKTISAPPLVAADATAIIVVEKVPSAPVLKSVDTVAMSVRPDYDRLQFVAFNQVGRVPLGIQCARPIADGYAAVPLAAVKWSSSSRPQNVVAKCAAS